MTVRDFVSAVEHFAPPWLAFPGDPVGLQIGDLERPVTKLLVSLDPGMGALQHGIDRGCDAWLLHHPLFYSPTRSLVEETPTARIAAHAIRNGVAVMGAHTNWDVASGGINDVLADLFSLEDRQAFGSGVEETVYKLVLFSPPSSAESLRLALKEAGAGEIGAYRGCAFMSPGTGHFEAGSGAEPRVGEPHSEHAVEEVRVEMLVPASLGAAATQVVRSVHPYEEPAYDFFPLADPLVHRAGRYGTLPQPLSPSEFQALVDRKLGCRSEAWFPSSRPIRKVGFVGGAASGDWTYAAKLGLDAFVTGEVRQHDAVGAGESGLAIVGAGHYFTEHPGIVRLGERVAQRLGIELVVYEPEPGRSGRPM